MLDRPAITALGVLVTFALLVQFGGFLAELSEQERRGRPGDTRLRHAIAVQPRRLVELVVDGVLVMGTFLAVYLLFVDGRGTELQRGTFQAVLPIVLGTTYVVYVLFGVYRRAWRYATTRADELVVTIPDAPSERLEELERACDAVGISHRILRDRPLPPTPTRALAE